MSRDIAGPRRPAARTALGAVIALAALLLATVAARANEIRLPDSPAGRHTTAWFAAFNGGDDEAVKAMLREHFAQPALAAMPVEARLERLRGLRAQAGGSLTPARVVEESERFLRVVARDAKGAHVQMDFECAETPPFGLTGIRLQMVPDPAAVQPRAPAVGAAELPARMDAYLREKAQAGEFAGAVLLARDGVPVFRQAYGSAERRFDVPNRIDTRFNFASIGKLLTKTAVAQLAEAGRLRLDDKLAKWLPDWPAETAAKITVAQLVEHRSGIPDFFNKKYERLDRSTLRHNSDYLALIRDEPLWFEPGAAERYSNGGYALLGEIVAHASGEDYYDYLQKHVLEPAGMKDTGWFEADEPTPNLAQGYYRDEEHGRELRENVFTRPARGSAAGGGYTTVDDLLRFETALRGGQLAGPAWSRWVLGDEAPSEAGAAAGSGAGPVMPSGYALKGGAPGISAHLGREGPWTLIVLSNLDRGIMGPAERQLEEWVAGLRE